MPTPKNKLGKATERYQGQLSGAYDRWVRELNPILKKAIQKNVPRSSIMRLVDDAIEILLDKLFDINRAAMLQAYTLGYGRAPDVAGMEKIAKSTKGFRESLETHMGPKLRSDVEGFLSAQAEPKTFVVDPLSLASSLGPQKSELLSGGGGYWALGFQGAGDKIGLIDKNREDEKLPKIKIKWVLDPGSEHCEPSAGHYGCPDLAGEYDSWDDLPTVPAGDVTCRGNCRCRIQIIEGKRAIDPMAIPAPRPKQTDPLASAVRARAKTKPKPKAAPEDVMRTKFDKKYAGDSIEHGGAFADDGTLIFEKAGTADMVPITAEEAAVMKRDGVSLLIHSHPTDLSFSAGDFSFASEYRVKTMELVTSRHKFSLKAPTGWGDGQEMFDLHRKLISGLNDKYVQLNLKGMTKATARQEMSHEANIGVAKKFNLVYKRETI